MKAYIIKVFDPDFPDDPNPFCYIDEPNDCEEQVQVTLNKAAALKTIEEMSSIHEVCIYTLIEFDI